jgi:diaminopimelate epimerase
VPTTLPVGPAGLPQGDLEVAGRYFTVAAAGMGNPHVVIPVEDVAAVDLERFGAALERHPAFPARTNVHFVQVLSPDHLVMRVWERGAGPTLACGTGACATLVVCHRLGLCDNRARLDLPGGPLWIAWAGEGAPVIMSGPAEAVFDGVVVPGLLGEAADRLPPLPERSAGPETPTAPPAQGGEPAPGTTAPSPPQPAIDCATACVNGCLRPEACSSAVARSRVAALLEGRSLDDLLALASSSAERRFMDGPPSDDSP